MARRRKQSKQSGCLLCPNTLDGGWWYPTIETPPGIFIEQCRDDEVCMSLTPDEFTNLIWLWHDLQDAGAWVKTGFETDREYGAISIKCDGSDFPMVQDLSAWALGDSAPSDEHRHWAVEFSDEQQDRLIRRAFWIPTRRRVPDLDERGRVRAKPDATG